MNDDFETVIAEIQAEHEREAAAEITAPAENQAVTEAKRYALDAPTTTVKTDPLR